jgi:TonB-linked SusC/RagA family outer membrane protein
MKKKILLFCALLLMSFSYSSLYAQTGVLTGKITDKETGDPLIGAAITVKGAKSSTLTDANGQFSLKNLPNSGTLTLSVSYLGYVSTSVETKPNATLTLALQPDLTSLNEVVVIGYGTVRRKDLTGAVSSVSGRDIAAVPVANASQALAGKLPGVNVITQDGRPDAAVSIRVRGGGSISQSNDPLFIVDGFPVGSISDIPANQIESIDVLKDASSTAIYGARGANGVIIVTTKGAKIGKVTVSYDGYGKFNNPTKYLEAMNAYDYIAYNWAYAKAISNPYEQAWTKLWGIGDFADDYNNPDGINHYKNVASTNFAKQAYGDSFSQNHNVNLSSGTEKTKFLLALNNINEDGMKVNSYYKRTNVSLKLDQTLAKPLKFSLDTRYTDINYVSDEGTTNGKGSILSTAYTFRPIATQDILGDLNPSTNTQLGFYDTILQDEFNPVARMRDNTPENRNRALRANTALNWEVIKGLVARTDLGLNTNWNINRTWTGAIFNNYIDDDGEKTFSGDASITNKQGWNLRWSNTLNYDVQGLGSKHRLNLLAGQEVTNSGSQQTKITGQRYPTSFDKERAFAIMDQYLQDPNSPFHTLSSSTSTPNRLLSYFGRANYSLADKYLFTATFRADGSSNFAPSKKWGYFPAGAVAWRVSEEDFLKSVNWLDDLKVRFSYGAVGNDAISSDLWNLNWSSAGLTPYSIDGVQQSAYNPGDDLPNPNLKWETTITRNLGFDFGFFNNRLYGSLELYKNNTKDLLIRIPANPSTGFQYTTENVGSTSNKGIELGLASDVVRTDKFNLNVGVNVNINRGKVEELATGVNGLYKSQWGSSMTQPNTGDYIFKVGSPVGLVRGYTYDGWYDVDDFDYAGGIYTLKSSVADIGSGIVGTVFGTTANKPGGQVAYPGVVKFKDISGPDGVPDGIIDENDVTVIGNMNPKHTGGLNIGGNYKNFDFRLDFNWSVGNQVYNAEYLAAFSGSKEDGLYKNRLNYLSSSYRIYDIKNDQIVSVTDPTELKALNANATTFLPYQENPVVSSLGIEDGSYLRLNTITIGYQLPKAVINKVGLSKLRVYGSIYNALLFTNYKGLDPDVNTDTNLNKAGYPTVGLDWGAYPRARSFTFGLNAQF